MEQKMFSSGILVGRFQHIHSGHEKLIRIGVTLCDKFLVFIGSASEEGTSRNPLSFEYRKSLIEKIFKNEIENGNLVIAPLNDLENKNELSPRWGKYVISEATAALKERPSLIIYGKDKDIFKCFDKDTVSEVTELLVDRKYLDISATKMREYIKEDRYEEWKKYANKLIYDEYENLRKIIY